MTVAYPLTAQLDHTELKYSLRSVEKFLQPPFEVVIIGDTIPEWINNIAHIWLPDIPGRPVYSVRRKVIAALHYCDELLFMNDDFYLLRNIDPFKFPYYYSGMLEKKGESGAKPLVKQLQEHGKTTNYYGHYPALYKKDFKDIMHNFTDDCITKSAYCNFIGVESIEIPDCKIMKAMKPKEIKEFINHKPSFSTGVQSIKSALPVLEELFPEPSKFEI